MNRNMIRQAQRQAQKLQDDMQKVQEELEAITVEGSAGGRRFLSGPVAGYGTGAGEMQREEI